KRSRVVRLSALAALFTSFVAAVDFAVRFAVFFSTAAATFLLVVAVFLVAAVVFLPLVGTLTSMVAQSDRSRTERKLKRNLYSLARIYRPIHALSRKKCRAKASVYVYILCVGIHKQVRPTYIRGGCHEDQC